MICRGKKNIQKTYKHVSASVELQKTKKNNWILKRRQVFEQLFFVLQKTKTKPPVWQLSGDIRLEREKERYGWL